MDGPLPGDFNPLPALLGALAGSLVGALVFYLYIALTLTVIALKTQTRNAWLAWIPIGNLFLMCTIGRRPAWWVLLLLIPLVNIVVGVMLWMSIAEMRGKPSWTGALAVVPVIGLLVPIYLAAGKAVTPLAPAPAQTGLCPNCGTRPEPGDEFCGDCGFAVAVAQAPAQRVCAQCGATPETGDVHCGACGTALPAEAPGVAAAPVASAPARKPVWQTAAVATGIVAALAVVVGGLGWMIVRRHAVYTPPTRYAPALPERLAGTMTEFPVDTDLVAPARPASVVSTDFAAARKSGSDVEVGIPDAWLPPGLEPESLPDRATAVTAVTYRPSEAPVVADAPPATTDPFWDVSESAEDWVSVAVLDTPPHKPNVADAIADDVEAAATGAKRTSVKVESPDGDVYTGDRIETPDTVTIVLDKQDADVVVIVYAPRPEMIEVADRLAANVGNGDGLGDYPEVRDSIWTLPDEPPIDLTLQEMTCFTPYDLGITDAILDEAEAGAEDAEARRMLARIRQLIPRRFIFARYADPSMHDWETVILEYPSPARAWLTWAFLQAPLRASGMRPTPVLGADGLYVKADNEGLLLCQRGPYLIFMGAPPESDAPLHGLTAFAEALQM